MKADDPFRYLLTGDDSTAIRLLEEAFAQDPDASNTMGLGVAYLWQGLYQKAWELFTEAQRHPSGTTDIYYAMAGVAKWCSGQPKAAVEEWESGLEADYTDAACISTRLLLYFVGVRKPSLFSKAEAAQMLMGQLRKVAYPDQWPVPYVRLVLGRGDPQVLQRLSDKTLSYRAVFDFYGGTLALAAGKSDVFLEAMRHVSDTTAPGWRETMLPDILWHPEFFLARYESAQATQSEARN